MKLAVVGSRSLQDKQIVFDYLDKVLHLTGILRENLTIVTGGAKGVDNFAEEWATINNVPCIVFLANWDKYGKSAGMIRNKLIINECEQAVAFWDGKSRGTKHSINLANSAKKKVEIVYV